MTNQPSYCNKCGSSLVEGATFCSVCGQPVGQAAAPAPQPVPIAYAAPPYSQGYSMPPYAPGNWAAVNPPPKKMNPVVAVIISIMIIAILGGGAALFIIFGPSGFSRQSQASVKYDALLSSITQASTPRSVARYEQQLQDFIDQYPGVANDDLKKLMEICVTYETSSKDPDLLHTLTVAQLTRLKNSDEEKIAACAAKLIDVVNADFEYAQSQAAA